MVTQEEINNMAPAIPIETHNMATQIEYETLPWYPINAVIDPDTGEILQYKDLVQSKEKRDHGKTDYQKNLDDLQKYFRESKKGTNNIRFVTHKNIPLGHTVTYAHIIFEV